MEIKGFIEVRMTNGGYALVSISSISLIEDLGKSGTRIFMKELDPESKLPMQVITALSYGYLKGMIADAAKQ